MDENKMIPIVFSANEKYAPYISVTISSIIRNSSANFFYKCYVLYKELCSNTILRLEGVKGSNYSTQCVDVGEIGTDWMYSTAYFSKEIYFRILIPELLTEYDKVLYLDCDIVVLKDIEKLYHYNLEDNLLGGVRNPMHEKMKKYIKFSLQIDPDGYINSGVLLINSRQCRKENFTAKALKTLSQRQDFRYPDQDLINVVCSHRICYLEPGWNFMWHYRYLQESANTEIHLPEAELKKYLEYEKNPNLIHYTGEIKPWDNADKYLSDYFWQYAKESVFFNLFLIRLNNAVVANNMYAQKINEIEQQLHMLTNSLSGLEPCGNLHIASEFINYEYLDKYNEVIGSKSYKIGRLLTFPFRKTVDIYYSIRLRGIKKTLKLFPKKMKLYKDIMFGKYNY